MVEIWHSLGVDWTSLPIKVTQQVFENTGIGFIYTPLHFPLTKTIWEYRDQIGKRPPFATMELIWCPIAGNAHVLTGFVHPPTETMFQEAFQFTTVKGLESSCDLPRDRTAIIGLGLPTTIERLHLVAREYGFTSNNVPLSSIKELRVNIQEVLDGKTSPFMETALWNGGFYLWRSGICSDMKQAIAQTKELLTSGAVAAKLQQLVHSLNDVYRFSDHR